MQKEDSTKMNKKYKHKEVEPRIYEMWQQFDVFSPESSTKLRQEVSLSLKDETFTVLMPPPNANAPLHCGHVTYAIQDLMARYKRMQGYKTLYLPGTDHAGFETQVVYERTLKKKGKSRFDFDRQTLYNDILSFVKENSDTAISQLKLIGMSADWNRNTFMLADHVIDTVYDTFIKMHKDGLIYKDHYLVNYSPHHGTTFSNLETMHKETNSPLYYVKYQVKDSDESITVATVRPETIYADAAVAVNPKDTRYKKLIGKTVLNPINNKEIPIIGDSYVDMEFGTGALKIDPGHDINDFEIGKRHNLEMISLINLEGHMNENAPEVEGMYVTKARKKTVEILQERGAIEKIDEKYVNNLLVDYKDQKPIEPMLLPNWFIKMEELAKPAIAAIQKEDVKFNQETWKKQALQWLDNIRDWPISRQIVFGIRIPAWYCVSDNPDLFVLFLDKDGVSHEGRISKLLEDGFNLDEITAGLQKLIAPKGAKYVVSKERPEGAFIQETDTFDTWFSSGQWPLTTLKYPDDADFKEFFPTDFMDTMWDILFFWIIRMVMLSLYLTDDGTGSGQVPFKNVYIHGEITGSDGKKMSKSKGNAINPMELVEKYGADALRMGILVGGNTSAKQTALSEDKVRGYRNFANKIWNMARWFEMTLDRHEFLQNDLPDIKNISKDNLTKEDNDVLQKFTELVSHVNTSLEKYRFADAGDAIYHFMWHEVADGYIEYIRSMLNTKTSEDGADSAIEIDKDTAVTSLGVFRHIYTQCLKLLHPFMPFVTEEVWGHIGGDSEGEKSVSLIVSEWPTV